MTHTLQNVDVCVCVCVCVCECVCVCVCACVCVCVLSLWVSLYVSLSLSLSRALIALSEGVPNTSILRCHRHLHHHVPSRHPQIFVIFGWGKSRVDAAVAFVRKKGVQL